MGERERLRQHLVCIGLLELAGVAYAIAYIDAGLYWFGVITVACMALGAIAPLAAVRGRLTTSAHLVTGSVAAVVISTSYVTGGITQAGYAWIYIVPLVAENSRRQFLAEHLNFQPFRDQACSQPQCGQ